MNNFLEAFAQYPNFEKIRQTILSNGVEQPFFDKDAVWGGYCLEQNSYDFAALICFLKDRFPNGMRQYAEIGSAGGGFFRSIYELVGFEMGISVDNGKWRAEEWPKNSKGIPYVRCEGDSHSKECEEWLKANLHDIDLFFIDGDHSYEGVCLDIKLASRILPKGTLVGFHDLYCARVPGVAKAYQEMITEKGVFKELFQICNFNHENPMGIAICEVV